MVMNSFSISTASITIAWACILIYTCSDRSVQCMGQRTPVCIASSRLMSSLKHSQGGRRAP
jgi:hypothetical protein